MSITIHRLRALRAALLIATLALLAGFTFAAPAQAAYTVGLTTSPTSKEASAYTDFAIALNFPNDSTPQSVTLDLPKGQLAALANASICTDANWKSDNCATSSKIGVVSAAVTAKAVATLGLPINLTASGGVYRLAPTGTEVGRFGLTVASSLSATMYIEGTFRLRDDGTYAIRASVPSIPKTAKVNVLGLGLGDANITINSMTLTMYGKLQDGSNKGFFFNPAECIAATTNVSSTAWDGTNATDSDTYTPTNCAAVPFNPAVTFNPNPSTAASPTAFAVNVSEPYNATDAKVGSPFKNVTLTMPAGIQLTGATNSDGSLAACSDAQFNYSSTVPDTCPAGSKIGDVTMDSPLVGPVPGEVFLAQPQAGPNDLIRLFVTAELGTATDAVRVKLLMRVQVDPTTGRLITTLLNLPAQPVKSFNFVFRAGTAPATRQPRLCGTYPGNADLVSYSATTTVSRTSNYIVSNGCPAAGRFRPTIGMTVNPTRAGAASTGTTTIDLPVGDEAFTSVKASLPPGMIANINGVTRCSAAQVTANTCPAASQIGTVADLAGQSSVPGPFSGKIYLTDAPDAASIAGLYIDVPVQVGPIYLDELKINASLRLRTDFGIDVVSNIPDTVRALQLDQQQLKLVFDKANFLVNPPTCTGNAITGAFGSAQGTNTTNTSAVSITGCATMQFAPSLAFSASPASAGGSSSLTTTVNIPASTSGNEQSPPKKISVTLPDGVSLSPSANSGSTNLTGCTDAQFTINDFADPACPAASAVGTVAIQTPSVGQLTGTAYLGTAVAGHTARVLLDAKSVDYGAKARVKLQGLLDVNATTGNVTAVFDGLPPVQFTSFALTMRGGTNPVLSMPRTCGTTSGSSTMTPASGSVASPTASLSINTNCADSTSFAPTLSAVASPTKAAANTTLVTTVNIPERHRQLSKMNLNLPAGLLANIATAPRCTIAQANASACAAATKIGSVDALAGQGTAPGAFTGNLYLTDAPTAGDVVGIAVDLPAVVGPIDLGHIITIASVKLRPSDYGIDVTADVPTDAKGIPLYLRQLKLTIDKSGFLTNPPTCAATNTTSTLTSQGGSTATPSSPFQATACTSLGFAPSLSFSAAPQRAAGASAFTTKITAPASAPGTEQGALKTAVVDLPTGVSLSPSINSGGDLVGCSVAQFAETTFADPTCPTGSAIGTAQIDVPQVGSLTGNVYLASTTPSGAVAGLYLDAKSAAFGSSVRVKLDGKVVVNATTGQTTATFDSVPAISFTTFQLNLRGGTNPAISMPRVCGTPSGGATLTPQTGTAVTKTATLTLDSNCADSASFTPTFSNAISPTKAGANSTMVTTIGVPEGHRFLNKLALSLPEGMLANIATATRCSIASATAGTCTTASKIGSVDALAGQGTTPGTFTGNLYLTDAPTSSDVVGIAVDLRAVVGPIDLGDVITIASVKLRPADYGIDISADVPTDVKGIPLFLRQLKLTVDRSGFLTNPVACNATSTKATLGSVGGSTSSLSSAFTATSCDQLGFNPTVSFTSTPSKAAGAGAFTTKITAPGSAPGTEQGALKKAVVDLPTGVSLSSSINSGGDLAGCTDAQFALSTFADPTCATGSVIGTAAIDVPQVGTLSGNVYLASTIPSGAIAGLFLDAKSAAFGSNVRVKLAGKVDVDATTGKTTATFDNAPAVAFTSFALNLRGGTNPAISVPRTCGTPTGSATLTPQSGSAVTKSGTLTIDTNCTDATSFAPTGSVALSNLNAGADTNLTTTINVPAGHRELAKVGISLPSGLLAKIQGQTRCTVANAQAGTCAAASAIGTVSVDAGQGTTPATFTGSAYLVDAPNANDIVAIGLSIPVVVGPIDLGKVNVIADVKLRSDYGIDITADVPTQVKGIPMYLRQLKISIAKSGFLFNPSTCGARTSTLNFTSASYAGATSTASDSSSATIANCDQLAFSPSLAFSATPQKAAGASAFTTSITLPASPAQSALKTASVVLPTGVSLSSSINSDGALTGCTDAQFDQATPFSTPVCATTSKIGTATIATASVGTMTGEVFLAATAPGHIARVFVHAQSASFPGAHVKMTGTVDVDASTGVTTALFSNAPEVPFTSFTLAFRGGDNTAIAMPRVCGTPSGSGTLTPYSSATAATKTATLTIDASCTDTASFAPTFSNVISPTKAGANSTMVTTINVPERHRFLDKLAMSLPAGMLANVSTATRCTIAQANASTCPAASKIGSASALAGQGNTLGTFNGSLYLTDGPTAADVVGIAVDLPAVVGPVDLGHVVTIASVKLRPADYGIDIAADVPTDVKGVPLFLRQLKLTVDKSGFLTNPVTCGASSTAATLHGAGGTNVTGSTAFTATNCDQLAFNPSVSFTATPSAAAGSSAFVTKITAPASAPGTEQGALKKAVVDLPTGVSLSASINSAGTLSGCTDAQFALSTFADPTCDSTSSIGTASIDVPQIGTLSGNVYLAQTTPTGAIAGLFLDAKSATFGSSVRVKLAGKVDVDATTGKTTATFDNAPAVAFTSFQLSLRGGANPAISVPRTCGTPSGSAALTSQNNAAVTRTGTLTIDQNCGVSNDFGATGSVALSTSAAGQDTSLTTTINVPTGQRELAKVGISLPAGLLAKIQGRARCTVAQATAGTCAAATEVGKVTATAGQGATGGAFTGSVYLVDAPNSQDIVGLGLSIPVVVGPVDLGKVNVIADVKLRSDYGIDITADVPTQVKGIPMYLRQLKIAITQSGFLFNPSTCGAKISNLNFTSVNYGAGALSAGDSSTTTISACDQLAFNPSVGFSAAPSKAAGASAFTTSISLPSGSAQSALKTAVVTLPTGVSLSPSLNSNGTLTGCTVSQFDVTSTTTSPTCAASSQIGTTAINTTSVGQLTGQVYLAAAAAGHVAGIYVHAQSTDYPGVHVKLSGVVDVDAATGVATATFNNAPEVPFTQFDVTFKGGSQPAISMPRVCGTPAGSASLSPHSGGAAVTRSGTLTVDQNCGNATAFAPTLTNVISPTKAAANSTMVSTIGIPEGHRALDKVTLNLPAGLLANVATASRCTIAQANASACPAATKIGTASALAGQGDTPATFNGSLYLTDAPSAGDVVGIAVDLPAVVGPVDLGHVITIASVKLRAADYGIDVIADVPTDVKGIPLFLRQLKLTVDKSGFLTNPATCAAGATNSTLHGAGGSTATPSVAFTATSCDQLGFSPTVSFSGAPSSAAGASAFTTKISAPASAPGTEQGALKKAVVDLPTGVSLSSSINSDGKLVGCTDAQFAQNAFTDPTCSSDSVIGTATIDVPQVGSLTGNVYIAQTTPSGAVAGLFLDAKSPTFGSSVRVKLAGKVDVDATSGKTTATFDNAPAIAFTGLTLALRGGTNPAISMPRTCGTPTGSATLTPQTGAAVTKTATLTVDQNCGNASAFAATGSVALSDLRAGQDTSLTTTVAVPSGHRELSKIAISLPAGLLAKIDGQTRCTVANATAGTCAAASEIGTISADAGQGSVPGSFAGKAYLVDAPNSADIVGIGLSIPVVVGPVDLGKVNVIADVKLRSDYGIDISADVPTQIKGIPMYLRQLKIAITKSAFLFNPSTCGDTTATLGMTSASYSGSASTASASSTLTFTQCDQLAFNPTLAFSATPAKAGGSGAFTTKITLPSTAQSALRSATVTLPAGLSLSPSIDSAGTLTGCTDAQFDQSTPSTAPTCPTASKIGTTSITTGSVGTLTGDVYLAATGSSHLARVLVYAGSSQYPGARVKMTGSVDVSATTGITTAVFDNAPAVPFTDFTITFQGGDSPAISLPRTCGTPGGSASLQSHAGGAPVTRTATLTIDQNCAATTFTPATSVTVSPTTAAAATALTTKITVPSGQQELSRVRLSLPSGLIAKIDGHQKCSIAAANAGTCAAASKIGTLSAKAGQGDAPATFAGGSVYLTDAPSAGDLVGLAVELPVKVGSVGGNAIVDLGKVTSVGSIKLRQDYGIDIDMPVPTSVQGIPMVLRELTLTINESGFMINPPTCSGNAVTGTLNSAQSGSAAINTSLAIDNCTGATFNPGVSFSAAPSKPAVPAAFTTMLTVPATGNNSPVKKAVVTLPTGVSLSASANAGGDLTGCTDAQFDASTWNDPTCPTGSNIGAVTIATPSVGAITGNAYLASIAPNGSIARVFLDASSSTYGTKVRIKVAGTIAVDATTGATTATFDNLPPVGFSSFALTLRGGSKPVMSLPRTCGTFAGSATLTPHAGAAANRTGSLVLDSSCTDAAQFGPTADFDLSPADAGGAGHLTTTLTVPGGDQELSKVKINLPEGLTAKLKGAARCTIVQAQADACPASTLLGSVDAKVGVPGAPFTESGKIYLTEGRNGNVAGMAIVLPAVVGPIDLGKVITIADVQLHSPDLALQISADVPTSVKGVRLDVRELKLAITKDDFLVNPSSCGVLTGHASFTSTTGKNAGDDATITVPTASCAAQTFDPQIAFSAGNPKPGEASDFTTTVTLANGPGAESPFKSVAVHLPSGMSLSPSAGARGDLAGCTDADFHQDDLSVANTCPAGSEIGSAKFETDLVGDLTGKAYLAPATNGNLARVFIETTAADVPNLTVRLIGNVVIDPTTGATDAVFDSVPAIPVTKFAVSFRGGDAPTLALPRLCGTANGGGTFTPVNGSGSVNRSAALALTTDCPDAGAFAPTVQLDRSTTAAGKSMTFTTTVDVPAKSQELSSLKMVLPAGLLGTISSVPACSLDAAKASTCDPSSQVGEVHAQVGVASAPFTVDGKAYLVKGDNDSIARLAIDLPAKVGPIDLGHVVTLADLKLRSDYGLTITAATVPTTVKGVRLDLHHLALVINKAGFMVNPVSCSPANGATTLGSAQGGSQARSQAMNTDSCDQLQLSASLGYAAAPASPLTSSAVTTSIRASAPAGQALDAMKTVRVTMPEGLSLSASAGARGDLAECTTDQFHAGNIDVDAGCPAGSNIGSVTISSPMVGTLTGDAYLGAKTDGHFAGIYLQAKAPDYPSLRVKLVGTLDVDPTTGRLTATFSDLPQVQVSSIDLTLRGGDAPVLSLPRTCGTFGADVNILRYGGSASDATGSLVLDQDCPDPNAFSPTIDLSTSTTQAGADTSLTTVVKVPARNQELTSLDLAMPSGLLGRLTVAPKCSVDNAKANACGGDSVIGHVTAKVGTASAPFTVDGNVYLTDGFDGSIAGLMFALPAKVGPIDLGTVVTLAQIKITGNDLKMGITANGIPTRVQGIPLNISQLGITIDKPGMVLNATNCGNQNANANFGSLQGGSASGTAGYAATGCGALNWQPDMKLNFTGAAADLKTKGHPTVTTVISQTEGQGNLRTANVVLPDGVGVDLKNVNAGICASPETAAAGGCQDAAKIGVAEIRTSALPNPVNASIYMVKVAGATLPGMAIRVRDQINFDIVGTTKLDKTNRVIANFDGLPDTPISKMTLVFNGGASGVLQLGKEICGVGTVKTDATLTSQHGATKSLVLPVDCNGSVTALSSSEAVVSRALATATFKPSGSTSGLTFALSNPNGISKIVLRMPRGAIFQKKASKLLKLSLTGAKAKTFIVNGERRMAISIRPTVAGTKVTKVKFKLPNKAIKINIKVRKVLENKKTSKKKRAALLAKLLKPAVTMLDSAGTATTVKITTKVAAK